MRYKFPLKPEALVDIRAAAERWILPGYTPALPFIPRNSGVITIGSCFADNIAASLRDLGLDASRISVVEDLNSPLAALDIVRRTGDGDPDGNRARDEFKRARLLIFTLGVALHPFLYDHPVLVVNRSDIRGYKWRMLSVDEVREAALTVINEVRAVSPDITVVLTISPIPLISSVNHPSVFGQDCLSKSTLRVAVESVLSAGLANIYYWPSFEIIRWLGGHAGPYFGVNGQDNRHIDENVLTVIMQIFIERYISQR